MPLCAQPPGEASVQGIRFWTLNDSTRISVEISTNFHYVSQRIASPDRVFFDIARSRPAIKGASPGLHVVKVGDARLKQIRVAQPEHGTTRIVLDIKENVEFRASQLTGPDRLMIELFDPSRTAPEIAPSVTSSRRFPVPATVPDPGERMQASAAIPTESPTFRRRFELPPSRHRAPRLTLLNETPPQLAPARQSLPVALAANRIPRLAPPAPPPTDRVRTRPAVVALKSSPSSPVVSVPAAQDKQGARSLTRMLGLKLNRIVIDAGHGGKDVGTIGATGLYEKDVVLDLALRLGVLLEKKLGAEVVFTRSDDTFIQLEDRPEIANQAHADLFISVHANASSVESVAGVETYFLSMTPSNRAAEELAARENSTSERSIADLPEMVKKIALNDKQKESQELATQVHSSLVAGVHANAKTRNRGVRRAPFIVLIGARMPAVLVEVGFLSNAAEEAKMRTPAHRQKVAESIFTGVRKYAESLSRVTPQLADRNTISGVPGVSQ